MNKEWPQESHAKHFAKPILQTPERLLNHCLQHAGAIVRRVADGYKAKDHDDEFIKVRNITMDCFVEGASPSRSMVNSLPILQYVPEWVPGAGFQKIAKAWRPLYNASIKPPLDFAKQQLASGLAEESFSGALSKKNISLEEEDVYTLLGLCLVVSLSFSHINVAHSTFTGGGETTAVTVYFFFLMLCIRPDIQQRAHAEMDRVTGGSRLPTFEDREHLPYLEVLTKEVMRYHPVLMVSLTRRWVFHPQRKMSRDREVYADPETFNPERFLGSSPEQDPRDIVFGFGRRICPGHFLAERSLYITLAICIATFDINLVVEEGRPVLPEYEPEGGPTSRVRPFEGIISARDPEITSAILGEEV
ncbi:hypothetical protein VKT23_016797 [Stygiomarasmius scandens]|uniref:Cytochrome P450 n=1 Tax=Marasmiellus scandens TaxID=2682957 RepID=A0ABR1IY50_9AGAR